MFSGGAATVTREPAKGGWFGSTSAGLTVITGTSSSAAASEM